MLMKGNVYPPQVTGAKPLVHRRTADWINLQHVSNCREHTK